MDKIQGETADEAWSIIKHDYDWQGPVQQFNDFKEFARFCLDHNKPPRPQFDKLMQKYNHLEMQGITIPGAIKGMLLIQALPPHWETSLLNIALASGTFTSLDINGLMDTVEHLYNADRVQKNKGLQPAVTKISAVKRKPGNPSFSNQKQKGQVPSPNKNGGQYQSGKGKKRHGTHGSGNGSSSKNNSNAHCTHFASTASIPSPTSISKKQFMNVTYIFLIVLVVTLMTPLYVCYGSLGCV